MKKPTSKVTRITIARLFNTGNYEHVRFEVTAEVPKGGSAKQTFMELGACLGRLKPLRIPLGYETAKAALNKLVEDRSETEKSRIDDYAELVKNHEAAKALRADAIAKLDDLGGSSKLGGGPKDDWDDEAF